MYGYITPAVLATEAVLTLAAFNGFVVLVEGPTDLSIFQDFLPADRFRVVHSVNKDIALHALSLIDGYGSVSEHNRNHVAALVDADFDRVLGVEGHPRAFLTDHHDLEVMMLWSPAFDRWLRQYATDEKLSRFGGISTVREKLLDLARFLGAMRLYAKRQNLAMCFDGLRYDTYIDKRTLATNRMGLCQGMHGLHVRMLEGISAKDFLAKIETELENFRGDDRDLVQGHDLIRILGIMMRYVLSSMSASAAAEESIAPSLRLAYRPHEWSDSEMGRLFGQYVASHVVD